MGTPWGTGAWTSAEGHHGDSKVGGTSSVRGAAGDLTSSSSSVPSRKLERPTASEPATRFGAGPWEGFQVTLATCHWGPVSYTEGKTLLGEGFPEEVAAELCYRLSTHGKGQLAGQRRKRAEQAGPGRPTASFRSSSHEAWKLSG